MLYYVVHGIFLWLKYLSRVKKNEQIASACPQTFVTNYFETIVRFEVYLSICHKSNVSKAGLYLIRNFTRTKAV